MHAIVAGNLAQAVGGYVARQDDGRNCALSLPLQPGYDLEPVEALRQVVVGDNQVRRDRPLGHQPQRLVAICGDQGAMTFVVKEQLEHFEHSWIVFDDQDGAAGGCVRLRPVLIENGLVSRLWSSKRHLDAEDRARAQSGANVDLVSEQIGKALHNGKTETEALASFPSRIVELMEFLEDRLKLQFRDAGAGIPDLDAEHVTAASAAEEEPAVGRVLDRVRQEIADDLLEKTRIAAYGEPAGHHTPAEAVRFRVIRELGSHFLEQAVDRKIDDRGAHDPSFELVDVEQLVEQARHCPHGLIEPVHESSRCFIVNPLIQHPLQQADCLKGLAQIMTGGSEKARLADIGPFRLGFRGLQRFALAPRLRDVDDRHQDLALR